MDAAMGMRPLWPWKAAMTSGMAAMAIQAQTRVLKGMKLCSLELRLPGQQHHHDARDHADTLTANRIPCTALRREAMKNVM